MIEDVNLIMLIGELIEVCAHGNFAEITLNIDDDEIKVIVIGKAFKKVKDLACKDGNKIKLIGAIVPDGEGGLRGLICGELETLNKE